MIDILHPNLFSQSPVCQNLKGIHAKKGTKNKMASTRLNIFGYAIVFMSLHFVAYSLQDLEKTVISSKNKIEEEEGAMFSQPEKATLNVAPFSSEVGVKGRVIGGRKMAKMVNKEHINKEETASKKASSSSSSSSETPSKRDHKPHKRSKKIDHNVHQVEGKMSSTFMVINADYHVPRSHPPKNN